MIIYIFVDKLFKLVIGRVNYVKFYDTTQDKKNVYAIFLNRINYYLTTYLFI